MSEQGPSPHLRVSDPAPTHLSEHLTSDLGMLMVAAGPDNPTEGWSSPPQASTPFVPQKANVGGDPPRAGCATVSCGQERRGQRSVEDMPQFLCFSFTCIRGFLGGCLLGFFCLTCFYPPSLSGRLLNIHNDLEGAAKVLASAAYAGAEPRRGAARWFHPICRL